MLEGVMTGIATALTLSNLSWVVFGCVAGTLIGMIPGLGPISAIALMIPISYSLDPARGLIMMAGVYYGAVFGGSTVVFGFASFDFACPAPGQAGRGRR